MAAEYKQVQFPNGEIIEFPADMSQAAINKAAQNHFAKQSGMPATTPQPATTGFKGIGQDIWQGIKNVPGEAGKALEGLALLPSEAVSAAEQIPTDPFRVIQNLLVGAGKTGEAIGRAPSLMEKYLRQKEILDPNAKQLFKVQPKINFEQLLGMGARKPGDELLQGISGYAPVSEAATLLNLGRGGRLARIGEQAAGAAAYEGLEGRNPIAGALTQGLMDLPFYAAGKAALPFSGKTNAAELAENMRIAEGKDVPLGEIIGSPTLKKVQENILDPSFGSGVDARNAALVNQLRQQGESLLEGRMVQAPSGLEAQNFKSMLKRTFDEQKARKKELYQPVDQIASETGLQINLDDTKNYARSVAGQLKDMPLISSDPRIRGTISRLIGIEDATKPTTRTSPILDEFGREITEEIPPKESIVDVKMAAEELGDNGDTLLGNPNAIDQSVGAIYKTLSKKLRDDLKSSVREHNVRELTQALSVADQNFAENFAPFRDKEVWKLLDEAKSSDAIARHIIQPGREDKFSFLKKVQDLVPEQNKLDLGYAYLSGAYDKAGNLNLKELSTRIDKLNKKQFETLFPGFQTREQLQDYVKLRKMSGEALDAMFNPKTGQRNVQALVMGAQSLPSLLSGHITPGTALAGAVPPIASRFLAHPGVKNTYLKALMRQKMGMPGLTEKPSKIVRYGAEAAREDEQ